MKRALGIVLLVVAAGLCAAPQHPQLSAAQRARYHTLIGELRCLVCQNRSIAESDAPLAADLRDIVARQIEAGHSDAQIKQYLVDRYGDFVLYKPRFSPATWLLWLGPAVLLAIAVLVAFWLWRRSRVRPEPAPPDTGEIERLLEDDPS